MRHAKGPIEKVHLRPQSKSGLTRKSFRSDFGRKRHSVQKLFEYEIWVQISLEWKIAHRVISSNDSSILNCIAFLYRVCQLQLIHIIIITYKWHVVAQYYGGNICLNCIETTLKNSRFTLVRNSWVFMIDPGRHNKVRYWRSPEFESQCQLIIFKGIW